MALIMQESSSHDLLQAHDELLHHSLCFAKSLALAVALDLRIPDAIHHHGAGGATLLQILAETALHPSKLRALRRLMRVLTVTGIFSVVEPPHRLVFTWAWEDASAARGHESEVSVSFEAAPGEVG